MPHGSYRFQKGYHDNVSEHCPEENMTRFETNSEKKSENDHKD